MTLYTKAIYATVKVPRKRRRKLCEIRENLMTQLPSVEQKSLNSHLSYGLHDLLLPFTNSKSPSLSTFVKVRNRERANGSSILPQLYMEQDNESDLAIHDNDTAQ